MTVILNDKHKQDVPQPGGDGLTTYEHTQQVLKYNLAGVSESDIVNDIDYLLFIDHEEDMAHYTHLKPIIEELAKLVVRNIDYAIRDFQNDMTFRIAKHLQESIGEQIGNVVYETKVDLHKKVVVKTTIDDTKIVSTTISDLMEG